MRTRFAPSPTGPLHLGHAYSACLAWDMAADGEFLLRIEDNDTQRCRPEYEAGCYEDLRWLGLSWPEPVMRLSDRREVYLAVIHDLIDRSLAYPCSCTRRDIQAAMSAPQEGVSAPHLYPGTCRHRKGHYPQAGDAVRLDMAAALASLPQQALTWEETGLEAGLHHLDPACLLQDHGDIVLMRKDIGTAAYHLSVVVDDAEQGITDVIRGADLAEATMLHRLLQAVLDLPTPRYHHHRLIRDENGKRLAKRNDARAISLYRSEGASPADIRAMVGLKS
ncbi:tRNA glutamyl-Q(34) synthetase GluQRS [Thioclava litoralis]|uniref:tRNA glutamyl-Q(34) synthetase GluQRS n=1 Tax=Thioclava litoralis TaxID=3076557 RepID=A0ABZ1E0T1_9RHOB|nr:tRNA glutamyl-Q(34) synthetase GluQRS [Thioclava sp. FTW29]